MLRLKEKGTNKDEFRKSEHEIRCLIVMGAREEIDSKEERLCLVE